MRSFVRSAWKAIAGGVSAAAAAAGITLSSLDWRELIAAFIIGALGVYFAPSNKPRQPVEGR